MTVLNGELANQTTFNSSFMSREQDTGTTGKVDLLNTDPASGTNITNVQRNLNALSSALGIPVDQVYNYLITWASTVVGASSSNAKAKIEALVLTFLGTGGHAHTGVDGQGSIVSATDLGDYNDYWAMPVRVQFNSASGTSSNVTSSMGARVGGGGSAALGVMTDAPDNKVAILDASTFTYIEDAGGQRVYGRLTYAAGVFTLTYYTNESGTETAHSLTSTNILFNFREVFSSATRPTFGADPTDQGTLDITRDVIDASATTRGLVSTGTQSLAGLKTLVDGLITKINFSLGHSVDSSTTGADQDLTVSEPTTILTNASLTSIRSITSPSVGKILTLLNNTGVTFTIRNESAGATAANRIKTGTGADVTIAQDQAFLLEYSTSTNRWHIVGGTGSGTGGGGASSIEWLEDASAPVAGVRNSCRVFNFAFATNQKLYALFKVPTSYVSGSQIKLKTSFNSQDTSGTVLMQTVTTLRRSGTDTVSSTTNQRTSTNSAVTLSGSTVDKSQSLVLDLTSATGQINSVSVAAGDDILIEFNRTLAGDTATGDVEVIATDKEVTTS